MKALGFGKIYSVKKLSKDLPASIIVFFVAVPLCLGISLASGAPLFAGLISGIVGGIVVGMLSDSALGVSGPAAGLAVIVLTSIQQLGNFEIFLVSVVIAGVLQIVLGLLRGGVIGYYFPSSVIKGMLSGIGIIIFLKQIPHALGYDADYEGDLSFQQMDGENTFSELLSMMGQLSPGAIILSTLSLIILISWEFLQSSKHKIFKLVQGPIVVVVVGIFYQLITKVNFPHFNIAERHLVSIPTPDNFKAFLGQFTFPDFSYIMHYDVWVVAFTVTVVASLETLLSVEATDKMDPMKRNTNTNRELFAQGGGNIISGLLGGLPLTQVIIRSSANIQSGGQTKVSAVLHGFFLLICVAFLPFALNKIPLASLACVLLVIGYKLAKPSLFNKMYRLGWSQFAPFVATIVGIVLTDLLYGIAIGIAVSLFLLLRNGYKNSHFMSTESIDNGHRIVKMTLAEEVTFVNKGPILKALDNISSGTHLVIDMSNSINIDYDVLEIIDNYKNTCESKGVVVGLINRGTQQTADY